VGERPVKGCGYAPYITYIIRQVTGYSFEYDKQHKVMKIAADLAEIDLSPPGAAVGGGSAAHPTSPRGPSRSSSRGRAPPSPIRKSFSAIFGMCKDMNAIKTRQHHEREARRKDTRTLKELAQKNELPTPRSPTSDSAASERETFEQQQARYEREFQQEFGGYTQSQPVPSQVQ